MLRKPLGRFFQNEHNVFRSSFLSLFHTSQIVNKKCKKERKKSCEPICVAVVLCGCGYLDGTEISEAVSSMIHITQKEMKPCFYAPDVDICNIIDHYTKEADTKCQPRNALAEAARISRSAIKPLCKCQACKHGALLIPGGFGAAKTLSDFAEKGADCCVLPELEKVIQDFICEKKPIGTLCIASVLVARVLENVRITLGKDCPAEDWPYADAIEKAKQMGAKVELKDVTGISRDKKYNVFSTPAWMYKRATYGDIHSSIGKLIGMMRKCINQ